MSNQQRSVIRRLWSYKKSWSLLPRGFFFLLCLFSFLAFTSFFLFDNVLYYETCTRRPHAACGPVSSYGLVCHFYPAVPGGRRLFHTTHQTPPGKAKTAAANMVSIGTLFCASFAPLHFVPARQAENIVIELPFLPFFVIFVRSLDVSKQLVGSILIHSLNVVAAYFFGNPPDEGQVSNPCVW